MNESTEVDDDLHYDIGRHPPDRRMYSESGRGRGEASGGGGAVRRRGVDSCVPQIMS